MDAVHVHLLLNHFPVIGLFIAMGLLALGVVRSNAENVRIALGLLIVVALAAVAVFLTGEPAEELVEGLPGVSENLIEEHEASARVALILLVALGAAALAGLVSFRRRATGVPRLFSLILLVVSLLPASAIAYAANLGGQIRHSEIRSDRVAVQATRAEWEDPGNEDD